MYNLDLNGSDNKPMPQMDNYKRDDWGGQILTNAVSPNENIRQDINGSTDKPYPQERNFVRNNNPEDGITGSVTMPSITAPNISIGQVKYARREGASSVYKDATRNTADDNRASAKAERTTLYEPIGEDEESQGGSI